MELSQKIELNIAKIAFLANQINRKTKLCCFFYDTAHCEYIEIKLYQSKDKYTETPINFKLDYKQKDSKFDWQKDSEDRLKESERCIEFLEKTLKNSEIDYSVLHALKEYATTSYEI